MHRSAGPADGGSPTACRRSSAGVRRSAPPTTPATVAKPVDCESDNHHVPGVNIGTAAGLWISSEEFRTCEVTAATLNLTGEGGGPAHTIYLDVVGLRVLAETAVRLADAVDSTT